MANKMMDFLGGGWKKELGKEEDKAVAIQEEGLEEYEKTHSNCCDAKIMMGICMACKEHCVSQAEE